MSFDLPGIGAPGVPKGKLPAVMPNDSVKRRRRQHDEDTIDKALCLLAVNGGNATKTHRELLAAGVDIDYSTIKDWKTRYPDRYRFQMTENARLIEQRIVENQRELAAMATDGAHRATEIEIERLEAGEVKDASASARNLATVMGITTTKILELTGRPTAIIEHRKPEDVVSRLSAIVDSTAVEEPVE